MNMTSCTVLHFEAFANLKAIKLYKKSKEIVNTKFMLLVTLRER
jgi:hypothetical protein